MSGIPRMTVPFNFFQKGRLFPDLSRRAVDYPVVSAKARQRTPTRYDGNIYRTRCGVRCMRVIRVADHLTGTRSHEVAHVQSGAPNAVPAWQPQPQAPVYAAPAPVDDYSEMMPDAEPVEIDREPAVASTRRRRW